MMMRSCVIWARVLEWLTTGSPVWARDTEHSRGSEWARTFYSQGKLVPRVLSCCAPGNIANIQLLKLVKEPLLLRLVISSYNLTLLTGLTITSSIQYPYYPVSAGTDHSWCFQQQCSLQETGDLAETDCILAAAVWGLGTNCLTFPVHLQKVRFNSFASFNKTRAGWPGAVLRQPADTILIQQQ